MSKPTHIFKLTTGVECEVTELTGKHQKLLTEQNNKSHNDKLAEMLADVIVRVGTKKDIDTEFVKAMLSADQKKILCEVRQFTLDFDPNFVFTYKYTDNKGAKQEHVIEIPISEGFNSEPTKKVLEDGTLGDADYTEYSEVQKEVFMTLPRSGEKIRFTMLDGRGEEIGSATNKNKRSSHTVIAMRNPVYFKEGSNKKMIPIKLNLDNLAYKDIEALRSKIKEVEGKVDTEIMFEHPEAQYKAADEKEVVVDVLGTVAFFFPSEAI